MHGKHLLKSECLAHPAITILTEIETLIPKSESKKMKCFLVRKQPCSPTLDKQFAGVTLGFRPNQIIHAFPPK